VPDLFNHAEAIRRSAERLVALVLQQEYPVAVELELRVLWRRLMRFPRDPAAQQAATDIENDEAAASLSMRFPPTQTGPG